MKTPEEITTYKNEVYKVLSWAVEQGHINDEQENILKEIIEEIEYELYPRETYIDENGWIQIIEEN